MHQLEQRRELTAPWTTDADVPLEWRSDCRAKAQADAIRRLIDKSEGGPIAPTVSAVIGALAKMNSEQLEQVRKIVDAAIHEER